MIDKYFEDQQVMQLLDNDTEEAFDEKIAELQSAMRRAAKHSRQQKDKDMRKELQEFYKECEKKEKAIVAKYG